MGGGLTHNRELRSVIDTVRAHATAGFRTVFVVLEGREIHGDRATS